MLGPKHVHYSEVLVNLQYTYLDVPIQRHLHVNQAYLLSNAIFIA